MEAAPNACLYRTFVSKVIEIKKFHIPLYRRLRDAKSSTPRLA